MIIVFSPSFASIDHYISKHNTYEAKNIKEIMSENLYLLKLEHLSLTIRGY